MCQRVLLDGMRVFRKSENGQHKRPAPKSKALVLSVFLFLFPKHAHPIPKGHAGTFSIILKCDSKGNWKCSQGINKKFVNSSILRKIRP